MSWIHRRNFCMMSLTKREKKFGRKKNRKGRTKKKSKECWRKWVIGEDRPQFPPIMMPECPSPSTIDHPLIGRMHTLSGWRSHRGKDEPHRYSLGDRQKFPYILWYNYRLVNDGKIKVFCQLAGNGNILSKTESKWSETSRLTKRTEH